MTPSLRPSLSLGLTQIPLLIRHEFLMVIVFMHELF